MIRRLLLIIITLLLMKPVMAQSDFHFTHYMYNFHTYNPANAGSSNNIIANLVARKQWVGMERSPLTTFINSHAYVPGIHGGLGLTIYNDRLGYENILNARVSYSYHLRLSDKASLAAGTGIGIMSKSLRGSNLVYEESGDQNAINGTESKVKPDVSFGIEYNSSKLTAGLSTTHTDQNLSSATIYKVPRHFYLYAKYNYRINEDVVLVPAFLTKSTVYVTQVELSSVVQYKSKVWGGLTYRHGEAIAGLVGFQFDKNWKVGYSYDFNVGKVMKYSGGSHEIMLSSILGTFNKKKHNYKTPRFFN
jgi:type IX secretion system PorP/SprF family membrane protein